MCINIYTVESTPRHTNISKLQTIFKRKMFCILYYCRYNIIIIFIIQFMLKNNHNTVQRLF